MAVTAHSPLARYSRSDQFMDDILSSSEKWFRLGANSLDDSFKLLPLDGVAQIGAAALALPNDLGIPERLFPHFTGVAGSKLSVIDNTFTDQTFTCMVEFTADSFSDCFLVKQNGAWHISMTDDGYLRASVYYLSGATGHSQSLSFELNRRYVVVLSIYSGSTSSFGLYDYELGTGTFSTFDIYPDSDIDYSAVGNLPLDFALANTGPFMGTLHDIKYWNQYKGNAEQARDVGKPPLIYGSGGVVILSSLGVQLWINFDEPFSTSLTDHSDNTHEVQLIGADWAIAADRFVLRYYAESSRRIPKVAIAQDRNSLGHIHYRATIYGIYDQVLEDFTGDFDTDVFLLQSFNTNLGSIIDFTVTKSSPNTPIVITEFQPVWEFNTRTSLAVGTPTSSPSPYKGAITKERLNIIQPRQNIINVHSLMREDYREITGKVEIVYSDPFTDSTLAVAASEANYATPTPDAIADNIVQGAYKWFSLHNNKLDGSFHPLSEETRFSHGWWGAHLSGANGILDPQPILSVAFSARSVSMLRVVGDDQLNEFPTAFTISLYTGESLIYSESVVGNTLVDWQKTIPSQTGITRITLTLIQLNKSGVVPKIMEFYTAVKELYYADDLESIHLLEELYFFNGELPLGAVSCNEIDITIRNLFDRFTPDNPASPLNGYLKKNRRIQAWLGVKLEDEIEWHSLGVFWSTDWKSPRRSLWAEVSGRDRLELLRTTDFTSSQVYQNLSLYRLFEMVFEDAQLPATDFYIDPILQSIIIPWSWFDRMSHREALEFLSSCALIETYCDRDGKIIVNASDPSGPPIQTFDEQANGIFDVDHPLAGSEIANYVEVITTPLITQPVSEVCIDETVFTVSPEETTTKTFVFNRVPVIEAQMPVLDGGDLLTIVETVVFAWGVRIVLHNPTASSIQVTKVTINGRLLESKAGQVATAQDAQKVLEDGKCKVTVTHPFIQQFEYAQLLANQLVDTYKDMRRDVTLESRGDIALAIGQKILAPNHGGLDEYSVVRQDLTWQGSLEATIDGKKL